MTFEIISNTETGQEPTTLEEAEIYFRSEESGGIEDDLIEELLTQARQAIENATNLSLIERTLEVYCDDWSGYLPFGPVDSDTLEVVSGSASIKGFSYPHVNESLNATITYDTKDALNKDLKVAIYELASFWYFRGDVEDKSIPEKVARVIKRYTRRLFV